MRLAMATLADTANVREGMINVLSAGISEMWRKDFPAPFAVTLPLLIEISEQDKFEVLTVRAQLFLHKADGNDQQIASMEAQIRRQGDPGPLANVPSVLTWGNTLLPEPGSYYVRVNVGDALWTDIPFRAHQLPQGN